MPSDENGRGLNRDESQEGYNKYIAWLADYLYEKQIPISERQKEVVKICESKEPLHAAIWISDCCGYYLWERDRLEHHARNNTEYEEIVKEEKSLLLESLTGDKDIDEPFEDVITTQNEYEIIKFDTKLEDSISGLPSELDVPYRGVLKTIIMRCSSREERLDVIKLFYDNFNESASK